MQENTIKVVVRSGDVSYQWRDTPGWKWIGDAAEVGSHIEGIAESKGGFMTTRDIVSDARDPISPLHPNFEWDDLKAAARWRDHTARNLVGSLVAVRILENVETKEPEEIRVRAFVNVDIEGGSFYSPIAVVLTQGDLYDRYIKRLYQEALALRRKAAQVQEFAGVVAAIDGLLAPNLLTESN